MHTLSLKDAMALVEAVAIEERMALMLWGPPGVGKSRGMAQLARKLNAEFVDIRLSQYDSVDLRGFPGIDNETGTTIWHPPSSLPFKSNPRFSDKGLIILFLDEINGATSQSVFAVAMQLVNERRVGEHKLRDNVAIVAAGNREGDKGVAVRMPTTMANRFKHVEVGHCVEGFVEHGTEEGWLPPAGVAFHFFRKELISTFDPSKPDKSFATPRTWEDFWRLFVKTTMPENIKMAACAGAVGDGPAVEVFGFNDIWKKMVPMSEIEKDPEGVKIPEEASMQYALGVAVSGTMNAKNITSFHKFLLRLDPAITIIAWQLATKRDKKLFETKQFIEFSKKFKVVFA